MVKVDKIELDKKEMTRMLQSNEMAKGCLDICKRKYATQDIYYFVGFDRVQVVVGREKRK